METVSDQRKLILAGVLLAIGVVLPIVFHASSLPGQMLLPMHIPVLLCGLICGWKYGGVVGLIVPLLSSLLTGMPPLLPTATVMALELATYGVVTGVSMKQFNSFFALIIAMLAGRLVLGIANVIFITLLGFGSTPYTWTVFVGGAFVKPLPGIIIQLILIPAILLGLKQAGYLEEAL